LVNPTTGTGTTTVQVEAFATGSGGSVDATLESISTEDYWLLTKTGNLTNTLKTAERMFSTTAQQTYFL
jgi:hypothetical protein